MWLLTGGAEEGLEGLLRCTPTDYTKCTGGNSEFRVVPIRDSPVGRP